jgi:hypothetical protein
MQVGASLCKFGASSRVHVRGGGISLEFLSEAPAVIIHVRDHSSHSKS